MEKHTYESLSLIGLSKYIAELLLVSEGSIEWVKEKKVLVVWHVIFFSLIVFILTTYTIRLLFTEVLQNSAELTDIYRLYVLFFWCLLILLFSLLAFRYYRHLLLPSKDLRIKSIALFALVFLVIFAHTYLAIYYFDPGLYKYPDSVFVPDTFNPGLTIERVTLSGDFLLYSATVATNIDYPKIDSASSIVSIVNVLQSIISIFLIALVISTFVQKASNK